MRTVRATEWRGSACRRARGAVCVIGALFGWATASAAQGAAKRPPVVGSPHGTPAGEARSVQGRVVLGSRAVLTPVAGAWVVLHRVGTDHAAPLDSMRTDAAGRYTFRYRTSGDPSAVYFVSNLHDGIAYFTSPFTTRTVRGDDAELVVHDTTSAPVPIHVRGRHVVFAARGDNKRRTILEVYELSNDSIVTRVAGGARGVVWQAPLLDGAARAKIEQADFSGGAVRFEEQHIRLAAPFAPGLKQISYSYDVPAETDYTFRVDEPADVLEVLVEDPLARAEGGTLASQGATVTDGRTFARFVAQDVAAGAVIRVNIPGKAAATDNELRVLALMAALGAVLLVGLARAMFRRQGGARARQPAATAAALRAQLAALDDAYANVDHPTDEQRADHWQARAHLDKQLSDAVAREQGLS